MAADGQVAERSPKASPRRMILESRPAAALARLAAPTLAAALVQSLLIVNEAWYAGGLGRAALASVALTFPILMLTQMLSTGAIGGAVSGAMARAIGANDVARANAVLRLAVVVALGAGLLKAGLMAAFGPALLRALGGDGVVLDGATAYAAALFPFAALLWLFNMLAACLRGTGDMTGAGVAIGIVVVVHGASLIGQATLGAPLGLTGAALGLVAAYAVGALYIVAVFARRGRAVRLTLEGWRGLTGGGRLLSAGLFAGSQSALTILYAMVATAVFSRFGLDWLAGFGVGVRLELLLVPLVFGFGGAAMVATGTLVGADRRNDAVRMGWLASFSAAALVGVVGGVLSVAPTLWTGFFSSDPDVVAAASAYLARVGPLYAFFGLGLCLYFASQGLETLLYPVLGAWLRFGVVVAGFWTLDAVDALTPETALLVVAGGMAFYGVFNAVALGVGPWRRAR